ncbi:MAG: F0F1 ATP synthase subunit B [Verrucomicrobiota bacterium]|nr:F0F1 ATP synthase subunit B [Verrucomicrobiota bacterium]
MNQFLTFGALTDTAQEIGRTFGWEPRLFISQVILFVLVALALRKWAYQPVLKMLEERRQRIAEGLANAEKIKTELTQTEAARKEILDRANTQANKLIEEARAAAARVQETETQKAIASAEQIIAKAHEATVADHARMLTDLKREIGSLVVKTTTNVTGKILTVDDQKRLAQEANQQLAA